MSCWALVPVKARHEGKQRLAGALPGGARIQLMDVMLARVLHATRHCPEIDELCVLTPERAGLPPDIRLLPDTGCGLNESLQAALPVLQAHGATRTVIVFADLPLIESADLSALVAAAAPTRVALAPDHGGSGTNGLCLTLPSAFQLCFGPGSFARHLQEAARIGATVAPIRRDGLAFDIDEPDDLGRLQSRNDPRYAFLP